MGSHASQIVEDKRWKIVQYVQTLQGNTLDDLQSNEMQNTASSDSVDTGNDKMN